MKKGLGKLNIKLRVWSMENNKIQEYVKQISGTEPLFVGYIVYGLFRTELAFYILMLLLSFTILDLTIELGMYVKKNKTIRGALSGFKWFCLAVSLTSFCVGLLTPAGVLYN